MRILCTNNTSISSALAIISLFSLGLIANYGFQNASACQCARLTPEMYYENSDVIFLGKVNSRERAPLSDVGMHVTFDVLRSWKGVDTTKVTIHTGDGSSCGSYGFRVDDPERQYLVYGTKEFSEIRVSLCGGTVNDPSLEVNRDLEYLEANFMPIELKTGHTMSVDIFPLLQILGGFVAVAVAAFIIIRRA
jgi:hypothetical protein